MKKITLFTLSMILLINTSIKPMPLGKKVNPFALAASVIIGLLFAQSDYKYINNDNQKETQKPTKYNTSISKK